MFSLALDLQTGRVEFERHRPGKQITTSNCIMGNVVMFLDVDPGTKSQNTLASAASVITIFKNNLSLASPLSFCKFRTKTLEF